MKTLLKFTLLSALIISGKLAKQPAQAAVAQKATSQTAPDSSMVMVHQVLTSEPVQPTQAPARPQSSGSGLLAEMF